MKKKEEFINEADIRNVLTYSDVLFLLDFTTDFHNVYTVCNIAPRIATVSYTHLTLPTILLV